MRGEERVAPLLDRDAGAGIERRLRPLRALGVLEALDTHVVDHLGALVGERDPDVLLALALAVRAPRHGHVCVDLAAMKDRELLAAREDDAQEPERETGAFGLPEDRKRWLERVARSGLVRGPGDLDRARPFVLDGTLLYTDRYFGYQERLSAGLRARLGVLTPPADAALLRRGLDALLDTAPAGSGSPVPVLDLTRLGAATAVLRGLTVLCGGPGTGKTYIVRTVLALLWAQWAIGAGPRESAPGPRVALAAPTGKAAARMSEAMQLGAEAFLAAAARALPEGRSAAELRSYLDGLRPSTLHRLLGWNPAHPTRFRHDASNPLPFDVVVVDETSMVDLALMEKLVDAVPPAARLILLGDRHQLSSVEAGTVLADLCGPTSEASMLRSEELARQLGEAAGLRELGAHVPLSAGPGPHDAIVHLDRSRRFRADSGIGQFARACLDPALDPRRVVEILTRSADVELMAHGEGGALPEAARRVVLQGFVPYLRRLLAGPVAGETLPELHAGVLRALDSFRVLCAHRAGLSGAAGVNRLVPELLAAHAGIDTRGELWVGRPVLVTRNDPAVQLFNGDLGVVVRDADGAASVVFPMPGGVRYVAPARLPEHQTAFAMTVHRSQGSELGHAMVVLPAKPSPILTRELVYTAVTRARERMTLVGSVEVLVEALARSVRRASGLEAKLWGAGR
jgi:exodeoxyribonuclease V alpha subunit